MINVHFVLLPVLIFILAQLRSINKLDDETVKEVILHVFFSAFNAISNFLGLIGHVEKL